MKRPNDIRPPLLWFTRQDDHGFMSWAEPNTEAHENTCGTFWGSHGCDRPAGHEGDHWCECCDCDDHPEDGCVGGPPYYGPDTEFFT